MNILTLTGSSGLEEVTDALAAYLTTEFGAGTLNPDHIQEVRVTNPFRIESDAERHMLDELLRNVRGVSGSFPGEVQASGPYLIIPNLDLGQAAAHIAAGLGGFRERIAFRPSAYVPVAHILRDSAIGSAVDFLRRAQVHSPLFFRTVLARQIREDAQAAAA